MKQASSVLRYIGKYIITVEQIEQLANEIASKQSERKLILSKIEVRTENSTLTYDNIEELREFGVRENETKRFELQFHEDSKLLDANYRAIHISGGKGSENRIWVSGDEEGWVTGTADLIENRIKRYQVWYSVFVNNDVIAILLYLISGIALLFLVLFIFISFELTSLEDSGESDTITPLSPVMAMLVSMVISIPISLWFTAWLERRLPKTSRIIESSSQSIHNASWTKVGVIVGFIGVIIGLVSLIF